MTIHLPTLHIPRRHLRKRKFWTIIGLFYVPLEYQSKMKNWIYYHSTGFLNFFGNACTKSRPIAIFSVFRLLTDFVCLLTYEFCLSLWKIARCSVILLLPLFTQVSLQTALYCWVCQILHEAFFQIINMYSIGGRNRASELL